MSGGKSEQSGFSAIELVVVVAIIVLIAAIALPYLFGARHKADQASAVASIHAIVAAEAIYQNTYTAVGYSPSLANLGSNGSTCETTSLTNACLIEPLLASGVKDGYVFDLLGDGKIPDQSYTITATPESSAEGTCVISSDQSGNLQFTSLGGGVSGGRSSGGGSSCGTN